MNLKVIEWSNQFETYQIPRWEELPVIDYYMDQVIEYINKYVSVFSNEQLITSSMINNYVKLGLIPPPHKKKYTRQHISMLIVITIIKQVAVISNIKEAIEIHMKTHGGSGAYNLFCTELENELKLMKEIVNTGNNKTSNEITPDKMVVNMISKALASKLLATKIIEFGE